MEKQVSIGIKKIKEIEFSINSSSISKENLAISFGVNTEFNIENETFDIIIAYDLKDSSTDKALVHIKVANSFLIEKIKDFVTENGKSLELPDGGLITMLSLSISHTRAILAKNTAGTIFEDYFIPIVNPAEIAKQVFKKTN